MILFSCRKRSLNTRIPKMSLNVDVGVKRDPWWRDGEVGFLDLDDKSLLELANDDTKDTIKVEGSVQTGNLDWTTQQKFLNENKDRKARKAWWTVGGVTTVRIVKHGGNGSKNASKKGQEEQGCFRMRNRAWGKTIPWTLRGGEKGLVDQCQITSRIANCCLFACPKCELETSSWTALQQHLKETNHGITKLLPLYVKKLMFHKCHLCSRLVVCATAFMSSHLGSFHGRMNLTQYRAIFPEAVKKSDCGKVEGNMTDVAPLVSAEKYFHAQRYVTTIRPPKSITTDLVANLCKFGCHKCPFESNAWISVFNHMKTDHAFRFNQFDRRCLRETRIHLCRLCLKGVVCDTALVKRHVNSKHQISTIENYLLTEKREASVSKACNFDIAKTLPLTLKKRRENFDKEGITAVRNNAIVLIERTPIAEGIKEQRLRNMFPPFRFGKIQVKLPAFAISDKHATFDIANTCVFKCKDCDGTFMSSMALRHHIAISKCTLKSYPKGVIDPENVVEARYHICRLCQVRILCDRGLIKEHTKKYHGMGLGDYDNHEVLVSPETERTSELRRKYQSSSVKPKYRKGARSILTSAAKRSVPSESVCDGIEDLCTFTCSNCKGIFEVGWIKFAKHVKFCAGERRVIFVPEHLEEVRYHDCYLCPARVLCDKHFIENHARFSHRQTLAEYESQKCSSENKVSNDDRKQENAMVILPKMANPAESLPDSLTSFSLEDSCLFGCTQCDFTTTSWNSMRGHNVTSPHGSGSNAFDSRQVREAQYHKCIICGAIIFCDHECIFVHVYKTHGIKLANYKSMVAKKVGKGEDGFELPSVREEDEQRSKVSTIQPEKYFKRYALSSALVPEALSTSFLGNLCTFACYACQFASRAWSEMFEHLVESHGAPRVQSALFERRMVSEARLHRCSICQAAVYCDLAIIKWHLERIHNITSLTFYAKRQPKDENAGNRLTDFCKKKQAGNRSSEKKFGVVTRTRPVDVLGNLLCKACDFRCDGVEGMRSHIMQTRHGFQLGQKTHQKLIWKLVLHECKVCRAKMPIDKIRVLLHHILVLHKFPSLDVYARFKMKTNDSCVN